MKNLLLIPLLIFCMTLVNCSSSQTEEDSDDSIEITQELDNSQDGDDVFSDLEDIAASKSDEKSDSDFKEVDSIYEEGSSTMASDSSNDSDSPYYVTIGRETIKRIAIMLYGSSREKNRIYRLNENYKNQNRLDADKKVYFEFSGLKPDAKLLTKQLIEDYTANFAEAIKNKRQVQYNVKTTTVKKGETLQSISKRLYGTVRLWTELYLINSDKVKNYDVIYPGSTISYYDLGLENVIASKPSSFSSDSKYEIPSGFPDKNEAAGDPVDVDSFSLDSVNDEDPSAISNIKENDQEQQLKDPGDLSSMNNQEQFSPNVIAQTGDTVEKNEVPKLEEKSVNLAEQSDDLNLDDFDLDENSIDPAVLSDDALAPQQEERNADNVVTGGTIDDSNSQKPNRFNNETKAEMSPTGQNSVHASQPNSNSTKMINGFTLNVRRIVYVILMVAVAIVVLFITRPGRKQKIHVSDTSISENSSLINSGGQKPTPLSRTNLKERISLKTEKPNRKRDII